MDTIIPATSLVSGDNLNFISDDISKMNDSTEFKIRIYTVDGTGTYSAMIYQVQVGYIL
jgi:hypothetical protein